MAHGVNYSAEYLTWLISFNPQITCCPHFTDEAHRLLTLGKVAQLVHGRSVIWNPVCAALIYACAFAEDKSCSSGFLEKNTSGHLKSGSQSLMHCLHCEEAGFVHARLHPLRKGLYSSIPEQF